MRTRGKGVHKTNYGINDIYEYYKKNIIKDIQVDKNTFKKISKLFIEKMMYKVLYESEDFIFPCKMGRLGVRKRKMNFTNKKCLNVDYHTSNKLGKKVYFTNDHRDGYKYKYAWIKGSVHGIQRYNLVMIRGNKRELAKILKTKSHIDYYEAKKRKY